MAFYGNYQKIAIYLSYYYSNIYNKIWQYGNSFQKTFSCEAKITEDLTILITIQLATQPQG